MDKKIIIILNSDMIMYVVYESYCSNLEYNS